MQPKAAGGLSHQRVKVVTRKRRSEPCIHMANGVMRWCLCTCVHAWLQKCTHLLMLCQSWRAVSTMTTGLQFPWRPVHRSWSLNLGRPELTAFSHASCRYNGRTPEPWCPTAKEKKKDFASCSKVAIFTLHNNAWLEYEWKNCRKLSFSDLLTFASVVSNQVVSR